MILHPSNPNVLYASVSRPTSKIAPVRRSASPIEQDIHTQAEIVAERQRLEDRVARSPGGPEAVMRFHKLRTTMKRIKE